MVLKLKFVFDWDTVETDKWNLGLELARLTDSVAVHRSQIHAAALVELAAGDHIGGIGYVGTAAEGIGPEHMRPQDCAVRIAGNVCLSRLRQPDLFCLFESLILPITHPSLPDSVASVPEAERQALVESFGQYIDDTTRMLDTQADASFQPSLTELDALVQSIGATNAELYCHP